MKRPDMPTDRVVALVIAATLFAVVLAYLITQPLPPTGRVVSVDRRGHITD